MKAILKNSIVFCLTTLLLVNTLSSFIVLTTFISNRAYFVDNFCVNKKKPALCCKASCHLDKVLKSSEEESTPIALKLSVVSFEFILSSILKLNTPVHIIEPQVYGEFRQAYSEVFSSRINPPPQYI